MRFLTKWLCWFGWHKYVTKPHHVIEDGSIQPWFEGLFDPKEDSFMIGDVRCDRCDKQSEDTRNFLIL